MRKRAPNRVVLGAGLTVGAALGMTSTAQAEVFPVTNLLDDGSGGTLREAVDDANVNPGGDVVLFNSGLSGNLQLTQGEIPINYATEIRGPGAKRVTINADVDSRIFYIDPGGGGPNFVDVEIAGLTLTGGAPTGSPYGGAVLAKYGNLTISDAVIEGNGAPFGGGVSMGLGNLAIQSSQISGNEASAGGGVGVKYGLELSITDSTISGNEAGGGGGVFAFEGSRLDVLNSTISGNETYGGPGGGIFVYNTFSTVTNSTLSGNSSVAGGGILSYSDCYCSDGKLTVRDSTVSGNHAENDGGGIYQDNDVGYTHTLVLNSIVAENTAGDAGPDLYGSNSTDINAGFTLIGNPSGASINEVTPNSNLTGVDPELSPLADNGGPTRTMALAAFSPAIDAGDGRGQTQDQRHLTRPVDFPNVPNSSAAGADGSDMGAYELQTFPSCEGETATIVAHPGVTTEGTNHRDVIVGTPGKDLINSRGGDDLVCAAGGDDHVSGGGGRDRLLGQKGRDELRGNGQADRLIGGPGADEGSGGPGNDTFTGQAGPDLLRGGPDRDRLLGGLGPDEMLGQGGPDRLVGGPQSDLFNGGPGLNLLYLRPEDDDVVANRGPNDRVFGEG